MGQAKYWWSVCLTVILLGGQMSPASAKDVVIATFVFPPYITLQKNGEVRGIIADIAQTALQKNGYSVVLRPMPWPRALASLKSGRVDAIVPLFKTKERLQTYNFSSEPIFLMEMKLYKHKDDRREYNGDLDTLKGATVVRIAGTRTTVDFDKAVKAGKITVIEVKDVTAQFLTVANKRADFAASTDLTGNRMLNTLGLNGTVVAMEKSLDTRAVFLAVGKTHDRTRLLTDFNTTLKAMIKDGTYQKLISRYHQPTQTP